MIKKILFKIVFIILSILCIFLAILVWIYRENLTNKNCSKYSIHISIDDTSEILRDLTLNKDYYTSIFNNNILSFCKEMHDEYGAVFSFYCYFQYHDFDLEQAETKYRDEFIENSDWLRFGYHAFDDKENLNLISLDEFMNKYKRGMEALSNIVGKESIDEYVRLTYFSGTHEIISYMFENGVQGFYTADDDRDSYYFNSEQSKVIFENQYYVDNEGITYIKTDLRLDNTEIPFAELISLVNSDIDKNIEIFTHEWLLYDKIKLRNSFWKIEEVCKFAEKYHIGFNFN